MEIVNPYKEEVNQKKEGKYISRVKEAMAGENNSERPFETNMIGSQIIENEDTLIKVSNTSSLEDVLNSYQRLFVDQLPMNAVEFKQIVKVPSSFELTFKNRAKHNTRFRFAKPEDAGIIAELHKRVYRGFYPYTEMIDPEYVVRFTGYSSHRTGYTALFEDLDHDKVVGCGIVSINPQTHKGYLRGLMILPEYQGKIAIMDCVINGMTYTYYRHGADTNLWYTETRSAHNKAQYLMEACGFRPCAIFPNKDIFYGNNIRESDVLEVTYNEFTLDQKRYEDIEILPLLLPIYEFMADRYNLPPAIIKREEIDLGLPFLMEGNRIKARCHLEKVKGKYNTSRYIIKSPNGGELSFKITETVMAAEELKVQANSYEEFMALFLYLRELMFKENIHYFEYYLPMNDVNKQAILLGLGFSVFGYVPAWEPIDKSEPRLINGDPTFQDNVNEGKDNKLIDSIIFGMALKFPKPESIKLTPYGKMLLKILLDLNHYG